MPDPRDPVTDKFHSPGPIRLADHQRHIIDEALSKDENGFFKYSTIIYSAPKKSGKSALTSAVTLYMAMHNPSSYVACIANDKNQSQNRLYGPIYTCFRLHRQHGGIFQDIKANMWEVILPNFTKLEAIPCDAAGEAGSQPLFTAWSEVWAYDTPAKQRLWTEMTIPPTLYGRALRWVESYAGYSGKSELLENLYDTAVRNGTAHPDFKYLQSDKSDNGTDVVFVNDKAKTFAYWDHEPRMAWQTPEFYSVESEMHVPSEFARIHHNLWSSPIEAFIEESWWESCHEASLPPLKEGDKTPVVVGIDMAESRDCAALVAVTRHPFDPEASVAVRAVRIFKPTRKKVIDQEEDVKPVIEGWAKKWNVVCWAYDPREMAKLSQECVRAGLGWFKPFGQTTPRAVADKQLHDMIVNGQVAWSRSTTEGDVGDKDFITDCLYKHITRAGANTSGGSYRLEKLAPSLKIDSAVALSQAAYMAMSLNITNLENKPADLLTRLARGELTREEFSKVMQNLHPDLKGAKFDGL